MKPIITLTSVLILSLITTAQEISNIRIQQEAKKVEIYYDLSGQNEYDIKVYCSQDGGNTWGSPLKHVSGHVGEGQKAGKKKMITWDVLKEREKLQGDIRFKIVASAENFSGSSGNFADGRDGQTYQWVKIGDQIWMAENLNYATRIGSWCYDNNESNCNVYGRLYNWETALKACPQGWHLPSDREWTVLTDHLGGRNLVGGKLKQAGTAYWETPNKGASNSSGFSAFPGGIRKSDGVFSYIGDGAYFWSSTEYNSSHTWCRGLYYSYVEAGRDYAIKVAAFSLRCVKD